MTEDRKEIETPRAEAVEAAVESAAPAPAPAAPAKAAPTRRYAQPPRLCYFCVERVAIDYKNVDLLRRFVNDRARIKPRRQTGTCAKHQRRLSVAIKRARHLGLLPFTAEHVRKYGWGGP
ncbi:MULTISPECIES: 30S ribosomal protein S18 [Thermoflexus]|uniref:Small ribosomal subunit protein bS18 n=1 Tax=Thermoflexus hugenholtzii JAD2 TaxID=877466 RepID=A0A212QK22_9CHLR|nr:30S ribosomal protein S18 [Thermoflexus sp.]SNB59567.1 small subunit ribosomal protein S18 [Thermoflexus hugenholtzii JAD2]